jgi:hypothetical protein
VKVLERVVLHPLLLAAFPVLYLFQRSLEEGVTFDDLIGPLTVVVTATGALFVALWGIWRDWRRAGLLSSLLVLLVLSFGHVVHVVEKLQGPSGDLGADPPAVDPEPYLLAVWGVLAVASLVITLRVDRRLPEITKALNVIAAALVLMNLVPILIGGTETAAAGANRGRKTGRQATVIESLDPGTTARLPDIYYLIFDRYADDEVLSERFAYDNSPFLRWLEARGFRVPPQSTLNYARTGHSLASSLNMRYLDGLARRVGQTAGIGHVNRRLSGFLVARLLKSAGYRYVQMGSWWHATKGDPLADDEYQFESLTEFASVLYDTTVIAPIAERLGVLTRLDTRRTEWARRQWQFAALTRIGEQPGPKFVFAHLLTPHPPYVTDRDGGYVSEEQEARWSFERKYVEQVIYTNEEIKELVTHLLAVPKNERPIIVLQADEGPTPTRIEGNKVFDWTTASLDELEMKFKLFTALYLPGLPESEVRRRIHPTFTPVNTFRLIFNLYLGGDFRLLPDRNYIFRDGEHPLDLIEVTDRLSIADAAGASQRTGARTHTNLVRGRAR